MFNKKSNKKIIFEEASIAAKNILDIPKPATNSVPAWYKKDKNFSNGKNSVIDFIKDKSVATYKMCVPLTDSITSGYNILLPASVIVTNEGDSKNYIPKIDWAVNWQVCDFQKDDPLQNYPVPYGHSKYFFRWRLDWKIITPDGYSLWVTHPSHRYDLPFTTLNGFVDTDLHPNRLLLPFFIQNNFEGIIEEGTPIAQVIPVKRDIWTSERKEYSENSDWLAENNIKMNLIRTYKKKYWSKKRYS